MPDEQGRATEEDIKQAEKNLSDYNDERKRDKLRRQIQRAHEWRVQVWAQSELKIRGNNAALQVLGSEPVELWEPDFSTDENLHHYSTMPLTK